ncbi:MAG: hypothetical protein MUF00_16680 [Gemmatimonadaceae bacterium]|nr:hypothetical protein [Gemmatimonadaceae bacterium]
MNRHSLTGLDGQNPLGFLAALGLLRIADLHAAASGSDAPRLAFDTGARSFAQIDSSISLDALIDLVLDDAEQQASSLLTSLSYDDEGREVEPGTKGAVRDLKPSPSFARTLLQRAAAGERRDADLLAALFSDVATDNNGRTKPTAFHFTAGQQQFVEMVQSLRQGVGRHDLEEALLGPWRGASALPSLSWDATQARLYALRATNPSSEKRGSVAGANWLAFQGLAYFPVWARRGRLQTTAVRGGWKNAHFCWPLWEVPATSAALRSLLVCNVASWTEAERRARGVRVVLASRIERSDQGGYGSFTPAAPVLANPDEEP